MTTLTPLEVFLRYLHNGKQLTPVQWIFDCPFCGKPKHLYVEPNIGLYYCFVCGSKGNAVTLANIFGRAVSIKTDNSPVCSVTSPSKDFLSPIYTSLFDLSIPGVLPTSMTEVRSHPLSLFAAPVPLVKVTTNIAPTLVDRFGAEKAGAAGLVFVDGHGYPKPLSCITPGRVLIPYVEFSKIIYFRGYSKGEHKKYCGPKGVGSKDKIYGNIDYGSRIVVTEGEFKAATCSSLGIPCVGLPGMNSSHNYFVSRCKELNVLHVYVIFDSQKEGMRYVDRAAKSLLVKLAKAGVENSRVLLPLGDKEKVDLEDFLLAVGIGTLESLLGSSV